MKKFVTIMLAVVMCLTIGAAAVGCGGNSKEKLIVYTEAGFAPWEFIEKGSRVRIESVEGLRILVKKV